MYPMKNCLISGGAGFIGSHLAERLVQEKNNVIIVDNFSSGNINNLEKVKNKIKIVRLDIRNDKKIDDILKNIDVIFHLAAIVSVQESIKNPKETFEVNLNGTINLLEGMKKNSIPKIIFASSSAVYGNVNKNNICEKDNISPISPYGLSKYLAEEIIRIYQRLSMINATCLRFFNVYGQRQDGKSPYSGVISKFIEKIKNNKRPEIYGNGNQTRDFVYVEDIVNALINAMSFDDKKNRILNIGTGKTISINDLYKIIINLLPQINGQKKPEPIYLPAREGDIIYSGADIRKAVSDLNYHPKFSVFDGLKKYLNNLSY